jgi:hypothetical protein
VFLLRSYTADLTIDVLITIGFLILLFAGIVNIFYWNPAVIFYLFLAFCYLLVTPLFWR